MFPWNIAKSAEAMFSRWAVKRVCKFVLKKKLGQFILGDIDLEQLDVQLREGTILLSDLAINVDYLNQKFGATSPLSIKEGSIGSLLVKMPRKGKGCEVEVDEVEFVLSPRVGAISSDGSASCSPGQENGPDSGVDQRRLYGEMKENSVAPSSGDVHEGVKTIAKMVKWLLTSFSVTIKKVIIAFDPHIGESSGEFADHRTMIFRVSEIACGTFVSEDVQLQGDTSVSNVLGISCLTNYVTFQGAVLELLYSDDIDRQTAHARASGRESDESRSELRPERATVPVVVGKRSGFSGNIRLNIPWNNGYLDIRKVDAEVSIDPIELKFQPNTIKWLLLTWKTINSWNKDGEVSMQSNFADARSSSLCRSLSPTKGPCSDESIPFDNGFPTRLSLEDQAVAREEVQLPNLISDWVPFSASVADHDLAESLDQFFECFDELRNSQFSVGGVGMLNWTCSVFSAITAASSLASGSMHISSEQMHVETNVRATVASASVIFSFRDEDVWTFGDPGVGMEKSTFESHFVGAECQGVLFTLKMSPQELKFEGTVREMEVNEFLSQGVINIASGDQRYNAEFSCSSNQIQRLQEEVLGILPQSTCYIEALGKSICGNPAAKIRPGVDAEINKITLFKTLSHICFRYACEFCLSDGSLRGPASFSVMLPPFVFWANIRLIAKLMHFLIELESFLNEDGVGNISSEKLRQKSDENVKRDVGPCGTTSGERLRGIILVPRARIVLCFPLDDVNEAMSYTYWSRFIALDIYSPLSSTEKGKANERDSSIFPLVDSLRWFSTMMTTSLHLNVGSLDIFLVTSAYNPGITTADTQEQIFSAQRIGSVSSSISSSVISMIWQEGPVTGPRIAERAKSAVASDESGKKKDFAGEGYEFISVKTVKDDEGFRSEVYQEIILSSSFVLHICLPFVAIELGSCEYQEVNSLLNQVAEGFSTAGSATLNSRRKPSASQSSIFLKCDTVEICIHPDNTDDIKSSLQRELPGAWFSLKLNVKKLDVLSTSDIGGINGSRFFWLCFGEGKLSGSVTAVQDEDFLLISCCNSAMRRGDGGGSNALSTGSAGTDIIFFLEPEVVRSSLAVTVRGGTVIAVGGRLDWVDAISSFFRLESSGDEAPSCSSTLKKDDRQPSQSSFCLHLVDVGLSYEPYVGDTSLSGTFDVSGASPEQLVACMIAVSSFKLSNSSTADMHDIESNIRMQDVGLLLCSASKLTDLGGSYSVQQLLTAGFVKIARESLAEVKLRTHCVDGVVWELEWSNSQIEMETCHDTNSALIQLASQLQLLFAPDIEESLVHLQARWANLQKEKECSSIGIDRRNAGEDVSLPASQLQMSSPDAKNNLLTVGLMEEICDNAFFLQTNEDYCYKHDTDPQVSISSDYLVGETSDYDAEDLGILSHDLSFSKVVSLVRLDSSSTSLLQKTYLPEFIEGYFLSDLRPLSELSEVPVGSFGSRNLESSRGSSGWYQDTAPRILENHISDAINASSVKAKKCHELLADIKEPVGRVIMENLNIKWRMYGGSDWGLFQSSSVQSKKIVGRDETICLELALCGIDCQYDAFPVGGFFISKVSLSVQDIHLCDKSRDAPLRLVLGYYNSKAHPRESYSKAFKMDLESVRPDPLIPLEEYRLSFAFLPLRLHLHQRQLDFLINFFGKEDSPQEPSPSLLNCSGSSKSLPMEGQNDSADHVVAEALLPYFQKFDVKPILVRVDYIPEHVDLAALRGGKYVELVNLVPWKGIDLSLKDVHAVGVYGWNTVFETVIGEWLEDISQNQINKVIRGLPTIRSLFAVGSAAAKLVSCPLENYKKEHKVLKGMQRGAIAFLRSISVEAVGLGVHLAAGAHDILLQAEYILSSIPPSAPLSLQSKEKINVRTNQPKDAKQGIKQAYESLSEGLGKSAAALIQTPLKKYQRGAGAGAAIMTAVQAVPAATIAPVSAGASAVHYALLGMRNSLDPEHKKDSIEKYMGPNQS
ncbi:hypothetical protein MLD38_023335 [Melastoma candidum]|uniref:Uncharacterized protein n=1 Tax=Melastoma candidum TaxID=119954 RepID=A0ACB9QM41_9MYRT|nr:hypothetical protein MLD38_023335 [Melastoma candidum]